MSVNLSSLAGAGWQFFTNDGVPLSGGKLFTYAAGTSTPLPTYTTSLGSIANSNPIILDSDGRTPNEIWLTTGSIYKFILMDSNNNLIGTYDDLPGINDPTTSNVILNAFIADLANNSNPAKGDALVGFRQSNASGNLANAVGRTVHQKLQEIVSVKDFGAVGDDVTDDAAAFGAALDALIAAGGGTLYIPTGVYRIKSKISKTLTAQQNIAIVGDGKYVSTLDFSTAINLGIELISTTTSANFHPNVQIKQIGLVTSRDNAGTAIKISYFDALTIDNSVDIDDIFIGQNLKRASDSGIGFGYWSRGIELDNARVSKISKLHMFGEIDKTPKTDRGIYLTGECTEVVIDNCNILEVGVGIEVVDNTEGVYIDKCVVTQCRYGYRFNFSGGEPQMILTNSHANASEACVWMTNCLQSIISNCLFYANAYYASPGPWPNWFGIIIDGANSSHNKIIGNTFSKEITRTGDTTTGIDITAGSWVIIDDNSAFGFSGNELTYGIYVRAGASETTIAEANQFQLVTTAVTNLGTRTIRQPLIQSGVALNVSSGDTVNFPSSFYETPSSVVACSVGTSTGINVGTALFTITGFKVYHDAGSPTDISWVAMGN